MSDLKQFCTFYVDQRLFGVDVLKVQEVIQFHETTEVPLAHPELAKIVSSPVSTSIAA